jgi:hypothetical protein
MAPEIKKKITNFLLGEEGQISKKALVGLGVVLAAVGLQTVKPGAAHTSHSSNTSVGYTRPDITGAHQSHTVHSVY